MTRLYLSSRICVICVLCFICLFAEFCVLAGASFAKDSPLSSHRSLFYFTANLDEGAPAPNYFISAKLWQMEIEGQLMMDDLWRPSEVYISSARLGKSFFIQGKIGLKESYPLNLTLGIERLDLSELLKLFSQSVDEGDVSGFIDGKINIEGMIDIPKIAGRLESHSLRWGGMGYNFSYIDLRGTLPLIFIEDARLFYDGGYFIINGSVDLSKLPDKRAWETIAFTSHQKTVRWLGWNIAQEPKQNGLSLKRNLNEDIKVSLKAFMNDEISTRKTGDDALELEYRLGGQNLKMRLRQEDEFMGLEHKLKF